MPKSYIKKSKQTKNIKNKTKKVKTRKVKKVKTHKIIYKGGLTPHGPVGNSTGESIFGTLNNPGGQSVNTVHYTTVFGQGPTYARVNRKTPVDPLTGSNITYAQIEHGAPGRPTAQKPPASPGRPSVRPPAHLLEHSGIVCNEPTPCKQKVNGTFICVSC